MAPKRSDPRRSAPPPSAVSSSEETASGSDESEEEVAPASPVPASKNRPPPPQKQKIMDTDDDDEEEEEKGDYDEPTQANPPSVPKNQPPPPRKVEESDTSGQDEEEEGEEEVEEGESSESEPEKAPLPKPSPKQKTEEKHPKPSSAEGKHQKTSSAEEAKKPAPFQRTWSTDDDVRILEALAAHRREHGALPQPDALAATLAGSLDNPNWGGKELMVKVQSLNRWYDATAKKDEPPSKDHHLRLFNLCKTVWGGDEATDAATTSAKAAKANGSVQREFGEMCKLYPCLAEEVKALEAAQPSMFKRVFWRIDEDKARALDVKIKKQRLVQMKAELCCGDLTKEVTKTLMDLIE